MSQPNLRIAKSIIIYKFILGFFETLIGFGIILFGRNLFRVYTNFTQKELFEDPHDLLANILERLIPYIFQHRGFIVFILLLIGLSKMIGAVGLWKRQHWGLDILVVVTILLLPFEIINLVIHPSLLNTIYFAINMVIALYLVNFNPHGYFEHVKKRIKAAKAN